MNIFNLLGTSFLVILLPFANAETRKFAPNPAINPCQNFYQHICSKEIESSTLPIGRSRITFFFGDGYENFLLRQESYLKQVLIEKNLSPNGEKIKAMFGSCMNEEARAEEEKAFLKRLLLEVGAIRTRDELLAYLAKGHKTGEQSLVSISTEALLSDPKKWRVAIDLKWLSLSEKSYYEDKNVIADFTHLVEQVFTLLKFDNATERAKHMVAMESQIAAGSPRAEEIDDLWTAEKHWTTKEFGRRFPLISKLFVFETIPQRVPILQLKVSQYDVVEKILREGDLQTLKDLLIVQNVLEKLDVSQPKLKAANLEFRFKHLGGPEKRRPLGQRCSKSVQEYLDRFLAKEMVEKYFSNYPRKEFTNLVESLRASLLQQIQSNRWLSAKSRERAVNKIKALRMALLYPEKEEDWNLIPLGELSSVRYLENLSKVSAALDQRTAEELKRPRNIEAWTLGPLAFDAYYVWTENRFYFPAAFALSPTFDANRSEIENLGSIGSLIAHELGHALDKNGSQFNENGVKSSIFDEKDKKVFAKIGEDFVKQFERAGVNGRLTLAENLADQVGLMTSYQTAFPGGVADREKQKSFFSAYARKWCTKITPERIKMDLKEDPHALPELRVNEQLKHLPAFAQAYQCPVGSEMVLPAQQILRVW